jgi:hypothetical protein
VEGLTVKNARQAGCRLTIRRVPSVTSIRT